MKVFKKFIAIIVFVLFVNTVPVAADSSQIKVIVNGKQLTFDQPPIIRNGKVLVPVRGVTEALGGEVFPKAVTPFNVDLYLYIQDPGSPISRSVSFYFEKGKIKVFVDGDDSDYDKETVIQMNPKATVLNGRTLVGLRDLADALGATTSYNASTNTITITRAPVMDSEINEDNINEKAQVVTTTNVPGNLTTLNVSTAFSKYFNSHAYANGKYAGSVDDNLFYIDNYYYIISLTTGELQIEKYDNNFTRVSSKELNIEFGSPKGIYYAEDGYFYVPCGSYNQSEKPNTEIIRVIKYDKDFNEVAHTSIISDDVISTSTFNNFGSLRMDYEDGRLVIHSSRERYLASDGLNHQSNLSILIDTKSMEVINLSEPFPMNHVSHSFNQFVFFEDDGITFIDHGDAYPRAVVMNKTDKDYTELIETPITVQEIYGRTGDNITGLFICAVEQTESGYLMLINTIDQETGDYSQINAFIYSIDTTTQEVTKIPLTNFTPVSQKEPKNSYITKIGKDRYVVLWEEYRQYYNALSETKYMIINEKGEKISEPKSLGKTPIQGFVTPVYNNGELIWHYYNQNQDKTYVYKLKVN